MILTFWIGFQVFQRNPRSLGFALTVVLHDYYAINAFEDCQVYLAQWDGNQPLARWDFYQYSPIRERSGRLAYFSGGHLSY